MKKKKANKEQKVATRVYLDRLNKELQHRFSVKNINYIVHNEIIDKGWLIKNEEGLPEAVKLLQVQKAPIYILGQFASAVIGWDMSKNIIVGSVWKNKEKIDELQTIDFKVIEEKLNVWYKLTKDET